MWSPGQLQDELDKGFWFLASCPLGVLFPKKTPTSPSSSDPANSSQEKTEGLQLDLSNATSEDLWSKILQLMGGEYSHFSHFANATQKKTTSLEMN